MMPRALVGSVMAMGRGPTRPAIERRLVREAVVAMATADASREPLAREIARRVVKELDAFLAEVNDPLLASIGEVRRKVCPSPIVALATDADVDTLALFVDLRVEQLRLRYGRALRPDADAAEYESIMSEVQMRLGGRYLRHMRSANA